MIFYVNAKTASEEVPPATTSAPTVESNTPVSTPEAERVISFNENGTIISEYFCASRLRIEWNSVKYENDSSLYINAELYLDSPRGIARECTGSLTIGSSRTDFTLKPSNDTTTLVCASSVQIQDFIDGSVIDMAGAVNLEFVGEGGVSLSSLNVNGKVYQSSSASISDNILLPLEHISQYPSLPSGDEITSLAMVLNYLKYNVDACNLCDLYLDKGPVGFTDFYKANAGNPRDTYNSYGCLAPVIVNSATKFINANGGNHTAYDYTGYNVEELYRQVSLGSPVIVWLCDDFDSTPSISRIWVVDGKTLYLKSNMACMVLIGYNKSEGTVTLANPAGNTFTLEMTSFERSFADMGSYAVIVK